MPECVWGLESSLLLIILDHLRTHTHMRTHAHTHTHTNTVKKAASPVAPSWGTPLCRPLTGPGVQAEVSLSVDPRVPWGSCTVEFHWPFGHFNSFKTVSRPPSSLHYIRPTLLMAMLWVKSSRVGEVLFKEHIGQFNSFKDIRDHLPCVVQECKCCYMYHLAL